MKIEKGTILIATDPCVMDGEKHGTLTVGMEYKVTIVTNTYLSITDDEGDDHLFEFIGEQSFDRYFKVKNDH